MKLVFYVFLTLTALNVRADISIANFHEVDQSASLYRGREPKKLVSELPSIGITDVIIFKNDVRGEVAKEKAALEFLEIKSHHIPFRWKDFSSVQLACEQILEAIEIMRDVRANNGKLFFHCTAGEDRTGALAALFRMMDEGVDRESVFQEEMCERGYADGNSHKPYYVTSSIHNELTPIFFAMARQIERGYLGLNRLNKNVCKSLKTFPTKRTCKNN